MCGSPRSTDLPGKSTMTADTKSESPVGWHPASTLRSVPPQSASTREPLLWISAALRRPQSACGRPSCRPQGVVGGAPIPRSAIGWSSPSARRAARSGGSGSSRHRAHPPHPDQKANLSGGCGCPRARSETAGAAYQLPTTNRIMGPKLHVAGAPRKCNPAIEDSNPGPRQG